MNEASPVPYKTRWMVWCDQESYNHSYARMNGAVWFWHAAGPRGYDSGAEDEAGIAVQRAQIAAARLASTQEMRPRSGAKQEQVA